MGGTAQLYAPWVLIDTRRRASGFVMLFWLLGLMALCALWALSALFVCESNGGIVLHALSLLIAWPVLCWLLIARWGGSSGGKLVFSAAVVPATLVGLLVLWRSEIEGLGLLRHRFPPARPMFSNDFVDDERTLLPYWYSPMPVVDRFGHWAWADYKDNVLLVVATGVPKTARFGALGHGLGECRVCVGDDHEDRFTTLKRCQNALVVVLPDGSVGRFDLGGGLAERFEKARRSKVVENVLRQSAELLEPDEKKELHRFLESYREPEPTRD